MNAANISYGAFKLGVGVARVACNLYWTYNTAACVNVRALIKVVDQITGLAN